MSLFLDLWDLGGGIFDFLSKLLSFDSQFVRSLIKSIDAIFIFFYSIETILSFFAVLIGQI